MEQSEILEGNKLIAEFMGYYVTEFNGSYHFVYNEKKKPKHLNQAWEFRLEEAKYHSSWLWLMPVVEKIEGDEVDLNISVVIKNNKCGIYRHKNSPYEKQLFLQESPSKIEAVWLAVVEFIKFYNQNKVNE